MAATLKNIKEQLFNGQKKLGSPRNESENRSLPPKGLIRVRRWV